MNAILRCLLLSTIFASTSQAIPPAEPKLFPKIAGQVAYAVWRGSHTVKEIRLERNGFPADIHEVSKKPTWYVVLIDVENVNEIDREVISLALSLNSLYPNMPRFEALPKGSMIVEFEADRDLNIQLGKRIEMMGVRFHLSGYAVGTLFCKNIVIIEKVQPRAEQQR